MKKPVQHEWILWATPLVALAPLGLWHAAQRWPIEWRLNFKLETARRDSCQTNLKQLGRALLQYTQDHNEKLPPASIGGPRDNWSDLLPAYLPAAPAPVLVHFFICPSMPRAESRSRNWRVWEGFRDYWRNARLAGRATSTLSAPASTFLLGEGNDGRDASNAAYSKAALPPAWLSDASSPLYRHLDGANFLFADGRVQWLRPRQAEHFGGRADPFAP